MEYGVFTNSESWNFVKVSDTTTVRAEGERRL